MLTAKKAGTVSHAIRVFCQEERKHDLHTCIAPWSHLKSMAVRLNDEHPWGNVCGNDGVVAVADRFYGC